MKSPTLEITELSWKDVERCCEIIASKLEGKKFHAILAIVRSGLVPAQLLAYDLGINKIVSLNSIQDVGKLDRFIKPSYCNASYLVVDDICDTGKTFTEYENEIKFVSSCIETEYAAIVIREGYKFSKDVAYGLKHLQKDDYVWFPWN